MKSGSVESWKVSERWGFRPKARQMRETPMRLMPAFLAMSLVLQRVAPLGRFSSVSTITSSTFSSVMLQRMNSPRAVHEGTRVYR